MAYSFADALAGLWSRSTYERGYIADPFGDDASGQRGLRRTRALVDQLGSPDREVGLVHVAGSKGKGSVSTMIAAMAQAGGNRVGLTTSPHLHSFRERIAIDGEAISEARFATLAVRALDAAADIEGSDPALGQVTTFELLIAMALLAFAEAHCQIAVLEVGLGGTFDATNVVSPLVSVITTLDLEHTAILGDTLAAIAAAKAGIVKQRTPVVISAAAPEALAVISRIAAANDSGLMVGGREWTWRGTWDDFSVSGPWGELAGLSLQLPGAHQLENAATAIAALWTIRDRFPISPAAIRDGLAAARIAGRFERVTHPAGHRVVLDGAHTPAAATALAKTLATEFPGASIAVILGVNADKPAGAIGAALAPIANEFIATQSSNPRAAPVAAVYNALSGLGRASRSTPDVATALAAASVAHPGTTVIVVTGSLATVADARTALSLGTPDPLPVSDAPPAGRATSG